MHQQSLWGKRSAIFIIFLIILGLGAASFLIGKPVIFNSGAASSTVPHDIRLSNISDTAFTITYVTDSQTTGTLSFGSNRALGNVVFDDRDKTANIPQAHTVHIFTIKNLLPNTPYYYSITSGNTTYSNNGALYTATTGPPLAAHTPIPELISGSVALPSSTTTEEVLVYVQPANGQLLSTFADNQGHYTVLLNNLRTNDLTGYDAIVPTDPAEITITDGISISHVLTTIESAKKIPPITLAVDYNFIPNNSVTIPQQQSTNGGFPTFGTEIANTITLPSIISPKQNEAFVDQQPQFSGTAKPNTTVTIVIHSNNIIQAQVTADSNGDWSFRPSTPLSVGDHTISITATDASGTTQTLTQTFSIFTIGTQVLQTATPSATTTPTNTPTSTPTQSGTTPSPTPTKSQPTSTPTSAPSTSPTPPAETLTPTITIPTTQTPTPTSVTTPIITPTDTSTPTPTQIPLPSPTRPPLPPTGNPFIFPLGIASIIATIAGLGLFIF